jgi:hypothetical protein
MVMVDIPYVHFEKEKEDDSRKSSLLGQPMIDNIVIEIAKGMYIYRYCYCIYEIQNLKKTLPQQPNPPPSPSRNTEPGFTNLRGSF